MLVQMRKTNKWQKFEWSNDDSSAYDFLQADVLYKLIEDSARLKGDGSEIVLDLFCGTGTIGLTLARRQFLLLGVHII